MLYECGTTWIEGITENTTQCWCNCVEEVVYADIFLYYNVLVQPIGM